MHPSISVTYVAQALNLSLFRKLWAKYRAGRVLLGPKKKPVAIRKTETCNKHQDMENKGHKDRHVVWGTRGSELRLRFIAMRFIRWIHWEHNM